MKPPWQSVVRGRVFLNREKIGFGHGVPNDGGVPVLLISRVAATDPRHPDLDLLH